MIIARKICKCFGTVEVLRGVDLEVRANAVTSVIGPSGAGKTTLLQILGSLSRPDSGQVLYDDVDISQLGDAALSRFRCLNIGFVFQLHRLLPEFSLLENVAMPALLAGRGKAEAFERARKLLKRLELEHRVDHRPAELSGGECQRGAVARALINEPKVILADEPTGSLDSANRQRLHKLFFELRDEMGATFLVVTHDESLAADSDHIISMADGRIIV